MPKETAFLNVYGDKAEVIHGSTKGYSEYLKAFQESVTSGVGIVSVSGTGEVKHIERSKFFKE